ncbi:hypothetical protein P152DRAFT_269472 [Eremomyces bilateralis CBS 781.70]|uniref:Uncharacterized protein n=1 Tax=Eremomyces bilateralis CBS 781.70 TaxID=1392243 RepID=A0A6G1G908_9PEZI|nr:uncharacterized protein P152DRAFT_269472 [Eremomyces bilateralis CBS 781.70]KAF1814391.1 hypothetical protein P152DRAFT_269472 [Eremomyces bilateralis CBS 781.70]
MERTPLSDNVHMRDSEQDTSEKKAEFSMATAELPPTPTSAATGLTPSVRRTSLIPLQTTRNGHPLTPTSSNQRPNTGPHLSTTIQFSPLEQRLSNRTRRWLRRSHLSEEQNNVESRARGRQNDLNETREKLREREGMIEELQLELELQRQRGINIGDEEDRIRELEREVELLRETVCLAESRSEDGDDMDLESIFEPAPGTPTPGTPTPGTPTPLDGSSTAFSLACEQSLAADGPRRCKNLAEKLDDAQDHGLDLLEAAKVQISHLTALAHESDQRIDALSSQVHAEGKRRIALENTQAICDRTLDERTRKITEWKEYAKTLAQELADSEDTRSRLTHCANSYRTEIKVLENLVQSQQDVHESRLDGQRTLVESLQQSNSDLEQQASDLNTKVQELENLVVELNQDFQRAADEKCELQYEIRLLDQDRKIADLAKEDAFEQAEKAEQKRRELEEEMESMRNDMASLRKGMEATASQLRDAESAHITASHAEDDLKAQIEKQIDRVADAQKRASATEEILIAKMRQAHEAERKRGEQVTTKDSEISILKDALKSKNAEMEANERKMGHLQGASDSLARDFRESLMRKDQQLKDVQEALTEQTRIDAVNAQKSRGRIAELEQTIESLNMRLREIEKQNQELARTVRGREEHISEQASEYLQLQDRLLDAAQSWDQMRQNLQSTIDSANREIQHHTSQIQVFQDEKAREAKELETLKHRLAERDQTLERMICRRQGVDDKRRHTMNEAIKKLEDVAHGMTTGEDMELAALLSNGSGIPGIDNDGRSTHSTAVGRKRPQAYPEANERPMKRRSSRSLTMEGYHE